MQCGSAPAGALVSMGAYEWNQGFINLNLKFRDWGLGRPGRSFGELSWGAS